MPVLTARRPFSMTLTHLPHHSCGMVYLDPEELKWLPCVQTWLTELSESKQLKEETREYILELFTKYVEDGLKFVNKKCTQSIPQVAYCT